MSRQVSWGSELLDWILHNCIGKRVRIARSEYVVKAKRKKTYILVKILRGYAESGFQFITQIKLPLPQSILGRLKTQTGRQLLEHARCYLVEQLISPEVERKAVGLLEAIRALVSRAAHKVRGRRYNNNPASARRHGHLACIH